MTRKNKEKPKRITWCWSSFCFVFLNKKNSKRDLIIVGIAVILLGSFIVIEQKLKKQISQNAIKTAESENIPLSELPEQQAIEEQNKEITEAQAKIDTSNWKPYQNTWYGFSLNYPPDWKAPAAEKPAVGAMWEQKINFRPNQINETSPFEGFDVKIYNVAKIKEVSATDEYPKLKSEELSSQSECTNIEGHLLETGDYPAEEIYIPMTDACFNAAFFFTNTRDNYIYTIYPKLKEGSGLSGDLVNQVENQMPEFLAMIPTWSLIDIQRPKPVPPKPKITAPFPLSYKVDAQGRLVCAKKNDHPMKSNKHKGKHLDMECCLDPDEYPNPHCYYDPKKYGKYL